MRAARQLEKPLGCLLELQYNDVSAGWLAATGPSSSVLVSVLVRSNTPLSSPPLLTLTFTPPPLPVSRAPRSVPLLAAGPASASSLIHAVLKQLGLLREVNCTQIMFDRKKKGKKNCPPSKKTQRGSAGTEGWKEGGREGRLSE